MNSSEQSLYPRIYDLVKQVPKGKITTYGDLARIVGTTPRVVGFAMSALPAGHDVPWQRVINSRGEISRRIDGDRASIQKMLLEREGIHFDHLQRVDLKTFRWYFQE